MAKRFFEAYNEVLDGTQCHRKVYITTALGGLCGLISSAYSVTHNPQILPWKQWPELAGLHSLRLPDVWS